MSDDLAPHVHEPESRRLHDRQRLPGRASRVRVDQTFREPAPAMTRPARSTSATRRAFVRQAGGGQHVIRPDVAARFRAVVARAVARSDRELAEHLAKLRPQVRDESSPDRRKLRDLNPRAPHPVKDVGRQED